MTNCEYWIWLQRTLGFAAKIDDLINYYGSAKTLYEAGSYNWRISGLFSASQINKLSKYSPSESGKIMKACSENHWDIITPDDSEYPPLLREICNFPAVLYVDGDSRLLSDRMFISMVGTRKASAYGVNVARLLAAELSKTGLTVVSGAALGIDSASHMGAVNSGFKTVAVLGCGFGTGYLRENEALRREIARNGALITEYPPFYEAARHTFPTRNRIISGMSLGTVVIEAGERSGSLITARLAAEQNRDVFAVPGDVFSSSFTGANKLIHDGAKPIFTAADVAEEYAGIYPDKIKLEGADIPLSRLMPKSDIFVLDGINTPVQEKDKKKKTEKENKPEQEKFDEQGIKALPDDLSANAKAVYGAIDGETEFDDAVRASGLPAFKVMTAVTELEMRELIEVLPGRKYKKLI